MNNKLQEALDRVNYEVRHFVMEIAGDTVDDLDNYYIKTGFFNNTYEINLFYKPTGYVANKTWIAEEFLTLGATKKLELEINQVVKKMILALTDPISFKSGIKKDNYIEII